MDRVFALVGAVLSGIAVLLGAFGAHGLKSRITPDMLAVFETGVRYQMYHGLAFFAIAWVAHRWPGTSVNAAGWMMLGGITVFSGSLYILAVSGTRWWGAITPIGGVFMILSWVTLAWAVFKAR